MSEPINLVPTEEATTQETVAPTNDAKVLASESVSDTPSVAPAKKPFNYVLLAAVSLALLVGTFGISPLVTRFMGKTPSPTEVALTKENEALKTQAKLLAEKEQAEQTLGNYVLNMIAKTRNRDKFSDAKKQIIARAVVRVATEIFDTVEHQHAFVAVLAIESEFQRTAHSGGTIAGIGQTAKGSFHEGLEGCGLPKADDSDITELDLGLYASACYYKGLLLKNNNDPYMAIVSYNQGNDSKSAKSYSANGTMDNLEALKYISRFTYLTRSVTDKKEPEAPKSKKKAEAK